MITPPAAMNNRRPDRAVIAYTNLIRRFFKNTRPIVLGGIEASLRRVAHYDFWSDSVRRSILFDAKADYLLYGMAEQSVLALARALQAGDDPTSIRGLCYITRQAAGRYLELPSYETVAADKLAFIECSTSSTKQRSAHRQRTGSAARRPLPGAESARSICHPERNGRGLRAAFSARPAPLL